LCASFSRRASALKETNANTPTTDKKSGDHKQEATLNKGLMFFTNDREFQIIANATERIFPKDDLGPGAIDLGVPYFIDNQLAVWAGHYVNSKNPLFDFLT